MKFPNPPPLFVPVLLVVVVASLATRPEVRQRFVRRPPAVEGFLDREALTPAQVARTAEIRTWGRADAEAAFRSRAERSGHPDRLDFELLRQDRRRAEAAYPGVASQTLLEDRWMWVDPEDHVPASWGGANSSSTQVGKDWFLDGPDLEGVVAPAFPRRASVAETEAFLAARRKAAFEVLLSRRMLGWSSSSSDGSDESVSCTVLRGCVVRHGEGAATRDTAWRFAYVPAEWAGRGGSPSFDAIRAMASFAASAGRPDRRRTVSGATSATTVISSCALTGGYGVVWRDPSVASVPATGGWTVSSLTSASGTLTMASGLNCAPSGGNVVPYQPGMTIGPGQSVTIGVPVRLR